MLSNQGLFSFHDFLGYLFPGIFCALSIYFVFFPPHSLNDQSFHFLASCQTSIIAIILCYLLGHLLSFLSSITIEKYSIWTLGYPSNYLFDKERYGFWKSVKIKRDIRIDAEKENNPDRHWHLAARAQWFFRIIIKILVCFILLPIVLMDIITRKILCLDDQYARRFSKELREILEPRYVNFFVKSYNINKNDVFILSENDKDYFRLASHAALKKSSENHYNKINKYITLYLFIRTTTFVSVVTFWLLFGKLVGHVIMHKPVVFILSIWLVYLAFVFLLNFILYLAFNKFYRKYSIEIILAVSSE
jgi:hypothetical protein